MIHLLKTWPEYFKDVVQGKKSFEYRKNDRDFHVGDCLSLQEYNPTIGQYTRNNFTVRVTYVLREAPGLPEGYCIMSIEPWTGGG